MLRVGVSQLSIFLNYLQLSFDHGKNTFFLGLLEQNLLLLNRLIFSLDPYDFLVVHVFHQVLDVNAAYTSVVVIIIESKACLEATGVIYLADLGANVHEPVDVDLVLQRFAFMHAEEPEESECYLIDVKVKHVFESYRTGFLVHEDAERVVLSIFWDIA